MTGYEDTAIVQGHELAHELRLERLLAPYAITNPFSEFCEETLEAFLRLDTERKCERAQRLRAPAMTRSPLTGHVLGAIYWSPWWAEHYTVKSIDARGFATIRWHGDGLLGKGSRVEETCTNADHDEIVGAIGQWL